MKKKKSQRIYISLTEHLSPMRNLSVNINEVGEMNIHFNNGLYMAFEDLGTAKELAEEIINTIIIYNKKLAKLKKED